MRRSLIPWALAILLLAACTPAAPDGQATPVVTGTPAASATPTLAPTNTPWPTMAWADMWAAPGQVKGALVHPDTGEPVAGLGLFLLPMSGDGVGIRPSEIPPRASTDETGAFLFADLVPGRYRLWLNRVSAMGSPYRGQIQVLQDEQGAPISVKVTSVATTDLGTIPLPSDALLPSTAGMPSFVNHAAPEWEVESLPLKETGCLFDLDGGVYCPEGIDSPVFDCDEIGGVSPLVGALEPRYPIAECLGRRACTDNVTTYSYWHDPTGNCCYCVGGMLITCVRYLVYYDGEFTLLETEDEFRAAFAPIETADEALSYALAVTGLEAYFGLHLAPEVEYFSSVIEDTHVDPVDDGYVVHLFQEAVFGCGARPVFAVQFYVTHDGHLEQMSRVPVYHHPAEAACVD